jgi:hypothetical protein
MVTDKFLGQGRPHIAGFAVAVQKNHSRARASDANMNRSAVGCDLLGSEFGGELDLRSGWQRDGRSSEST